jgi:hypothetical protein
MVAYWAKRVSVSPDEPSTLWIDEQPVNVRA